MSPRKQSVNPIDTAVQPSSDSSISLNDAAYAIGQEAARGSYGEWPYR